MSLKETNLENLWKIIGVGAVGLLTFGLAILYCQKDESNSKQIKKEKIEEEKNIKEDEKEKEKENIKKEKNKKKKMIIYYVLMFAFSVFVWYMVSTFISTYYNTKLIWGCMIGVNFGLSNIFPFLSS